MKKARARGALRRRQLPLCFVSTDTLEGAPIAVRSPQPRQRLSLCGCCGELKGLVDAPSSRGLASSSQNTDLGALWDCPLNDASARGHPKQAARPGFAVDEANDPLPRPPCLPPACAATT